MLASTSAWVAPRRLASSSARLTTSFSSGIRDSSTCIRMDFTLRSPKRTGKNRVFCRRRQTYSRIVAMSRHPDEDFDDLDDRPSKSERKRNAHEAQALG